MRQHAALHTDRVRVALIVGLEDGVRQPELHGLGAYREGDRIDRLWPNLFRVIVPLGVENGGHHLPRAAPVSPGRGGVFDVVHTDDLVRLDLVGDDAVDDRRGDRVGERQLVVIRLQQVAGEGLHPDGLLHLQRLIFHRDVIAYGKDV